MSTPNPQAVAWHEVELMASQLASRAKSPIPPSEFFGHVLQQLTATLGATGVAIWLSHDGLRPEFADGELAELLNPQGSDHPLIEPHQALCDAVVRAAVPKSLKPQGAMQTQTVLAAPIIAERSPIGVIEVVLEPDGEASGLRVLELVAELTGDYLRRQELERLRLRESRSRGVAELALQLHSAADLQSAAFELVNEVRRFANCDRVSLALNSHGRCRVHASSGVEFIETRSMMIKAMSEFAASVVRSGKAVRQSAASEDSLAEDDPTLVDAFLEASGSREVIAMPLVAPQTDISSVRPRVVGVLVAEQFKEPFTSESRTRLSVANRHAAMAIDTALWKKNMVIVSLQQRLGMALQSLRRRWLKFAILLTALFACIAVLTFVEGDFDVRAEGTLNPQVRREVFAPNDGQIDDLEVKHDQSVIAGDRLLSIHSPELDLEFERLEGEYRSTLKRLSAVAAARVMIKLDNETAKLRQRQLTAELEEIKQLQSSQERQLALISDERQRLVVMAPIDGRVITWDVERRLESRPVQRGQTLLTLAKMDGAWEAEIWVPDRKFHWLEEQQSRTGSLNVSLSLIAEKGAIHEGQLEEMGQRADVDPDGQPGVWLTFRVPGNWDQQRPGANVMAKIHCGRRSLGAVWLGDVIERLRAWWVF